MADVELQRKNMVESQVRPSDITDRRIIRAMSDVPRELYVPSASSAIAYGDLDIRLDAPAHGTPSRALLAPRVLAKLLQLAVIEAHDDVLIVGAGMGYSAAIVARLAKSVTALEECASLAAAARKILAEQGVSSAEVIAGPLVAGASGKAPFDVILVDGGAETVPQTLLDQLGPGGRLVVVSVQGAAGKAMIWRRHASGFDATEAFDASASVLPGFAKAPVFSL